MWWCRAGTDEEMGRCIVVSIASTLKALYLKGMLLNREHEKEKDG